MGIGYIQQSKKKGWNRGIKSFDCVDLQPAQDGLLGAQLEDDDQAGDGEREPGMDFG